ncbi:MAG: hypothetical protein ACSHX0_10440 [Akkermansiaceae bacterium]
MSEIPNHLKSTIQLLERTFPDGVSSKTLPFLLKVLYEHLSDENLIVVVSNWLNMEEGFVHNEVYRCVSISDEDKNVIGCREALERNGFAVWLEE